MTTPPIPASMSWLDRAVLWLATGLGLGYSPVMPGTIGALLGIPLAIGIFASGSPLILIGLLALVGVPICGRAAKLLGKDDPGAVVWDEFTTVPLAFLFLNTSMIRNPWILAAGFCLHRLFDISKIPPAKQCERWHGGLGIVADDWVAGAYSCATLHLLVALGVFGAA